MGYMATLQFGSKISFTDRDKNKFPGKIQKHGVTKGKYGHFLHFEILWFANLLIFPCKDQSDPGWITCYTF